MRFQRSSKDYSLGLVGLKNWLTVTVILVLLSVSLIALIAQSVASSRPPREIQLVIRDMAFYLADNDAAGPNPTLRLRAGEEVRIILRNQDFGIVHGFAIDTWALEMVAPKAGEESVSVLVHAPSRTGIFEYVCTPHSMLMKGTIEVVASERAVF